MSRIGQLIVEHCPKGVCYQSLERLGRTFSGLQGKTKNDFVGGIAPYVSYRNIFDNTSVNLNIDDLVDVATDEKTKLHTVRGHIDYRIIGNAERCGNVVCSS